MKYDTINPGRPWLDTNGRRIQAHGGNIYYDHGVYYWIGENKQFTKKGSKIWTWGVKAYSSADLMNWRDEGLIISPEPDNRKSPLHPSSRLDRPHVIFNPKTGKYVAWLKFCDKCYYAILMADSILGPYVMVNEFYQPYGKKCGDFDLALDEKTGEGYLFAETDHLDCIVCRLNHDFSAAEGEFQYVYRDIRPPYTREGITHTEHNGKHYIFSSGMTGYTPNPSEVAVSDSWMGPYTVLGDPHVNDDSCSSFNSQISGIFRVHGTEQYVAVADRWMPEDLMDARKYEMISRSIASRYDKSIKVSFKEKMMMIKRMMMQVDTSISDYVLLPIDFSEEKPRIFWRDSWKPEQG